MTATMVKTMLILIITTMVIVATTSTTVKTLMADSSLGF